MPKIKEAKILLVIQDGKFFQLVQTANFQINYVVWINISPLLFFLLSQSTSDFRHFKN
jgi:hypothetical protein